MKTASSRSIQPLEFAPFSLLHKFFLFIVCYLSVVFSTFMFGRHILLCALIIELCVFFKVRHNSTLFTLAVAVELGILFAYGPTYQTVGIEILILVAFLLLRQLLRDERGNNFVKKADLHFVSIFMLIGMVLSTLVLPGTFTVLRDGSLEYIDEHSFFLINPLTLAQPIDNRSLQGMLRVSHEHTQEPIPYLEVLFRANPDLITSVATYTQFRELQTHGIRGVPASARTKEEITEWIEATYPYLRVKIDEYL